MKIIFSIRALFLVILLMPSSYLFADSEAYRVNANSLKVRISPSVDAPVIRKLSNAQKVTVFESVNGWGRISKYFELKGESNFVAEWVSMEYLTLASYDSPDLVSIKKSLYPWNPLSVTLKGGDLIVQLNERRITQQIYKSTTMLGICTSLLLNKNSLDGIDDVYVLNKFSKQGFVFYGKKAICSELMEMSFSSKSDTFLMSYTRMPLGLIK